MNFLCFSYQHQIGIFLQGLQIGKQGEYLVEIQKANSCKDEQGETTLGSFQCPIVEKTKENIIIPSLQVIDKVCLVHDCGNGNCSFSQAENTIMVERECITKETFTYVHNTEHNFFLLNKFHLGECLQYFNIA